MVIKVHQSMVLMATHLEKPDTYNLWWHLFNVSTKKGHQINMNDDAIEENGDSTFLFYWESFLTFVMSLKTFAVIQYQ